MRPTNELELAAIVKGAAASGTRIKVVGAGHSFAPIAMCNYTNGSSLAPAARMINLDLMTAIHRVERHADGNYSYVTVGAGIRLRDLNIRVGFVFCFFLVL